jgi:glycosyltransferase involved in cell wall biosynthesis
LLLWIVRVYLRIFRLLRSREIDLLHSNDNGPVWFVVFATWLTRVPLVVNLRDTKAQGERRWMGKYRLWNRFANRWMLLSREMCAFYREHLEPTSTPATERYAATYSIVDLARFRPLPSEKREESRQRAGFPADAFVVGFFAAFSDKKNQLEFIRRAIPVLTRAIPNSRVVFFGDFDPDKNSYARACLAAVEELEVADACHFAGFISNPEEWYPLVDVVVVPTRKEGLARCMIEALSSGTPVVSFDVCSAREVLEQGGGKVVSQRDYPALVEAIVKYRDSTERKSAGELGRRTAEQLFAKEHVLARHLGIYRAALRSERQETEHRA